MIKLNAERKENITRAIQVYMQQELDLEVGQFAAEFFLDFMIQQLGPSCYNQALDDVHAWMSDKFLYLADDLHFMAKVEKEQ